MSSAQGLSRQQKGNSVVAASAPARGPDGGCIGDLESTHHEAMMDTVDLSRSQRLLVADATRLAREGSETSSWGMRRMEDDSSEDDDSEAELFPTTFYPEGIFEELPRLHPDLLRPAFVAGQDWDGVEETKSTLRSVKRVLRAKNATGVTFLIPTKEQRPWSPPIGYQTVYKSYFQDDTRCWFPIPRLITAYARRRDIAISQLLNGSLRLAVTLSVLAEEIDMPMSVRSFEEMTSITDMKDGTYSVKMRPNCNVCAGHPNKTQNWQRSYFFIKSDDSAFEEPPREDYRVLWNRSCVGHPTSPVYPEDFLKSVRAVALLRIYRWSEITVEKIRELKDRIARREWRSDLPTVLPIRTKRLDIFPKDIQKRVSEAKRMGTLPDLSAMLAAQLGLASEEGPSTTVPRIGERGGSGVERSAEEASDVPPSGEPQKKKKKKKKRTEKPADEQSENPEEPTENEEGDVQEEELQPEEEASEAEISGELDDAVEVGEREESEIPLNAARPDGSEEDSGESPLLIRRRNDEVGDEARSPILASSREGTPVPIGEGVAQVGTSSRGSAILRRVPGVNFPDKVSFHYEGPAPLVYVPEKCGEFLRQLRGRVKPLPAVKDLIFGGEYEEAARAKLLGDSATNVVIDKYDTALKGALGELELAKEYAEKEEASARQLNASRADVERLNGMVARIIARRDELKAELEVSRGVVRELERKNAELESEKVLLAASHEREMRRLRDSRILEVTRERGRVEARWPRKLIVASLGFAPEKSDERAGSDISQATIEIFAEQEKKYEEEAEKLRVGEIPEEDLTLSPLVLDSQFVDARILASLDPYGSNAGLIDPEIAASLHVPLTHPTEERREDPTLLLEGPLADPEIVPRSGEVHASPAARESSVRASELSALNDRESDQEA
ncbi:meiosis-specific protein ASY2-like [Brassica napus]|uniref:meiosis-specific protein ASY2-like n=1 Tax=Brassica napus TaxID=3708 RepID=UPI00207A5C3D|nr:meiosis-specific protein ASY2-like [Brassica napus]